MSSEPAAKTTVTALRIDTREWRLIGVAQFRLHLNEREVEVGVT
jgi:hypothetical protein